MKTIEEIRRHNLYKLFLQSGCRFDNEFNAIIDVPNGLYSQYKNGTKEIGSNTARKIETNMRLEKGWMDNNHEIEEVIKSKSADNISQDMMDIVEILQKLPVSIQDSVRRLLYNVVAEIPASAGNR